jgi:hypothetical protein
VVTAVKPVDGSFTTVTATATYAWVAGATTSAKISFWPQSLVWHWNGKTWAKTAAPAVTEGASPEGFAVTGADSVWLGGLGNVNAQISDMLMHWNGRSWSLAKFPLYGVYEWINGMAAGPKGTAWAVGSDTGTNPGAISMYFNGKSWAKTSGPANPKTSLFGAVAAVPGGTAWAVGYSYRSAGDSTLVARWTGKAWSRVPSPTPAGGGQLSAVAATSAGNAWAVGYAYNVNTNVWKTVILHWNGKTWS